MGMRTCTHANVHAWARAPARAHVHLRLRARLRGRLRVQVCVRVGTPTRTRAPARTCGGVAASGIGQPPPRQVFDLRAGALCRFINLLRVAPRLRPIAHAVG